VFCIVDESLKLLGEMKGFLKGDGTFVISKVPSGSYVVEILNPNYLYEPVRVEINNKGKFRARKVNVSFAKLVM
jgi:ER membrane protein complex subunit 7